MIPCFSWDISSRWFPVAFLTLPNLSRLGTGMADVIAMAGEWSLLGNLFYPSSGISVLLLGSAAGQARG